MVFFVFSKFVLDNSFKKLVTKHTHNLVSSCFFYQYPHVKWGIRFVAFLAQVKELERCKECCRLEGFESLQGKFFSMSFCLK